MLEEPSVKAALNLRLALSYFNNIACSAYAALSTDGLTYEDDLPKAVAYALGGSEAAAKLGESYMLRAALLQQIDVALRQGDRAKLQRLLASHESVRTPEDPRVTVIVVGARATIAAWDGRFAEAHALLRPVCKHYWAPEERSLNTALCALLLAADDKHDAAVAMAESAARSTRECEGDSPSRCRDIVRLLCALVEALAGRFADARRSLRNAESPDAAPAVAMHESIAGTIDYLEGTAHADAARDLYYRLDRNHYGGYARVLEAVLHKSEASRRHVEILTPAELAVLRSIDAGDSPKMIAHKTGRSVHTVRTQLRRVIEKFNCSGRDQALRMARARALI